MTCIAVLNDKKGNLWFASDRRITADDMIIVNDAPKTKLIGNIIVAGAGSAWITDLIMENYKFPLLTSYDVDSPDVFAYKILLPSMLKWLRDSGYVERNSVKFSSINSSDEGASLLIGVASKLYELVISNEGVFIIRVGTPYAIGCGGAYALGSLRTTEGKGLKTKDRLVTACKVAAMCSSGCDDRLDITTNKGLFE